MLNVKGKSHICESDDYVKMYIKNVRLIFLMDKKGTSEDPLKLKISTYEKFIIVNHSQNVVHFSSTSTIHEPSYK